MNSDSFDSALDDLEVRLERLCALYEQFLAGHQKVDPVALEKDIGRRITRLCETGRPSSALSKERLSAIIERHQGFQRYWERLSGRMKSGAHQRPVAEREDPRAVVRTGSSGRWDGAAAAEPVSNPTLPGFATERPPISGPASRAAAPRERRDAHTPPLGTPAVLEPWSSVPPPPPSPLPRALVSSRPPEFAPASVRPPPLPDSTQTLRDLRPPHAVDSAPTRPNLHAAPPSDSAITTQALHVPDSSADTVKREHDTVVRMPRLDLDLDLDKEGPERAPSGNVPIPLSSTKQATEDQKTPTAEPPRRRPEDDLETVPKHRLDQVLLTDHSALTLEQLRDIHARLVAATPDNVRPVSLERLARSLEETEQKLRGQYGDRTITFDVIVKDGRAIIKPIVH